MKRNRIMLLFFVFLSVVGQQFAANQYAHPKLQGKEKIVRKLLMLPPRVEVQKHGMKGAEGMVKESGELSRAISSVVARQLEQKGCEVVSDQVGSELSMPGEDSKFALTDVQNKYDRIERVMLSKPKDVRKGRFSIGDDVLKLDLANRGDALVFIRANGIMLTTGKKVLGLLVPGNIPWPIISLSVSLVDSKTGEVLFFSKVKAIGDFVGEPEKVLSKPVSKSFKNFPGMMQ